MMTNSEILAEAKTIYRELREMEAETAGMGYSAPIVRCHSCGYDVATHALESAGYVCWSCASASLEYGALHND